MESSDLAEQLLQGELTRRTRTDVGALPLLSAVPRISKRHFAPTHLGPLADLLTRARDVGGVRALVSVPPQHGKTELVAMLIAWWLRKRPDHTLVYASYSEAQALSKSDLARGYALDAGVTVRRGRDSLSEWRTPSGGGLLAVGVGGRLTGQGARCVLLDDPYRNVRDAGSALYRQGVEDWWRAVAATRIQSEGSLIVVHTRWHPADLIGTLAREPGWEVVNLPVADAAGEPLLPERTLPNGDKFGWTRETLAAREVLLGPYLWSALYMGAPRPRGGSVFRVLPTRYERDPRSTSHAKRVVVSLDAAGTASDRANHSAIVAQAFEGEGADLRSYVLEVDRWQLEPQDSAPRVLAFARRWGNGSVLIERSRDGLAVGKVLSALAPQLSVEYAAPLGDKFTRAQLFAAAWNQGRVQLPLEAAWLDAFQRELSDFRGEGDEQDDQVDAAVHGFNHALSQASQGVQFFDR